MTISTDTYIRILKNQIQTRNEVIEELQGENTRLKTEREYWKDFTFKILKVLSK